MMTKAQATREARRRFGKTAATSVHACGGQAMFAGRKTTSGCTNDHLQPCPGGPLVYQITSLSGVGDLVFCCIQVRGDSWEDCFARLDARKEAARVEFEKYKREREEREAHERTARKRSRR